MEGRIAARRLIESGIEARIEKCDGIERVSDEEDEFNFGAERAKIHTRQVARRMNGFPFESTPKESHDFSHRAFVVLESNNRGGLHTGRIGICCNLRILKI